MGSKYSFGRVSAKLAILLWPHPGPLCILGMALEWVSSYFMWHIEIVSVLNLQKFLQHVTTHLQAMHNKTLRIQFNLGIICDYLDHSWMTMAWTHWNQCVNIHLNWDTFWITICASPTLFHSQTTVNLLTLNTRETSHPCLFLKTKS